MSFVFSLLLLFSRRAKKKKHLLTRHTSAPPARTPAAACQAAGRSTAAAASAPRTQQREQRRRSIRRRRSEGTAAPPGGTAPRPLRGSRIGGLPVPEMRPGSPPEGPRGRRRLLCVCVRVCACGGVRLWRGLRLVSKGKKEKRERDSRRC